MIEKPIESDINQEYASLKREYNALSRKFARLGKEYDNLTQLYKQAVALRDYNEQEKETQIRYNQMLRDYCPDDMFLLDAEMQILLYTSSVKAYFNENEDIVERKDFLSLLREVFDALFVDRIKSAILKVKSTKTPFYYEMEAGPSPKLCKPPKGCKMRASNLEVQRYGKKKTQPRRTRTQREDDILSQGIKRIFSRRCAESLQGTDR